VYRREPQQAGRAGLTCCRSGPEAALVCAAANRAACNSCRTQPDVIRAEPARAEPRRVGAENGKRQHFAIAGKAPGTGRIYDDAGSGLREARPRSAEARRRHLKAFPDEARAAIAEAAVHPDAEVCGGAAHGGDQAQQ